MFQRMCRELARPATRALTWHTKHPSQRRPLISARLHARNCASTHRLFLSFSHFDRCLVVPSLNPTPRTLDPTQIYKTAERTSSPVICLPVVSSMKYAGFLRCSASPPSGWCESRKNCGIVTSSGMCARGPPSPYIVGMFAFAAMLCCRRSEPSYKWRVREYSRSQVAQESYQESTSRYVQICFLACVCRTFGIRCSRNTGVRQCAVWTLGWEWEGVENLEQARQRPQTPTLYKHPAYQSRGSV